MALNMKQFKKYSVITALAAAIGAMTMVTTAQAITYGFKNISANNVNNALAGETQLSVSVDAAGTGRVVFTFNNLGPEASSITDVYFDTANNLAGISAIEGSAGVKYSQGATPGNLPAANNATPVFETAADFSADSDAPVQPNGVNPGEWLKIYMNLKAGDNLDSILAFIANGSLRIGIHVQGFSNGGSESFVHGDPGGGGIPSVPDPSSTGLLLGLSWMAVEAMRRRRGC